MFAKLGDYLTQQNIRRPMRVTAPSGERFVVLPAREYTLLTGIDVKTLPEAETFDTVSSIGEAEVQQAEAIAETEKEESASASALATLSLEEEISVEHLPL